MIFFPDKGQKKSKNKLAKKWGDLQLSI